VVPSNDAPLFALAAATLTVAEDAGSQSFNNFVTGIARGPTTAVDEATQFLTFTVSASNPSMFSMQPALSFVSEEAARLTFQVADNAFGDATITVTLRDDGGTANKGVDSLTRTFTITATPVNDAPTFTIPLTVLTVVEDQFSTTEFTRANFLESISPGPLEESSQSTTVATSSSNPELFSTAPRITNNVLTFRTAPDAFGEATVTVTVSDNVQPPLSTSRTFVIRIMARNDRPSFTAGRDLIGTTLSECRSESACAYTFPAWATAITAGPANEAAQTLTFNVLAGAHAALFVAMPSISPSTGTLTFSLRPFQNTAASGPLSISVTLTDDGGRLNEGEDAFSSSFRLEVPAFIDAPGFDVALPNVESLENEALVTRQNFIARITTGTTSTQTDNLRFISTPADALFFETAPSISMDSATSATLTYRSRADANGQTVVTVILENILTSRRTTK
ncbi:MAG: hypothetical protein Q8J97_05475, partial [Flavobacteriaceae bacterium]|nr:hypothetical protein [Flavobacteriaceae bacterium]